MCFSMIKLLWIYISLSAIIYFAIKRCIKILSIKAYLSWWRSKSGEKIFIILFILAAIIFPYFNFTANAESATLEIPGHANNLESIGVDLTIDELTKPLDSDLYYGRTLLTEEGQKAWDYAIQVLLNYDNSENLYSKDSNGNTIVTIDYANEINAYPTVEDAKRIQSYLVRNEPRMFLIKLFQQNLILMD